MSAALEVRLAVAAGAAAAAAGAGLAAILGGRRGGFGLGALGVHEPLEAGGDVAVGIVETGQMAVDGGGLRRPPALLQLRSEGVQIAQHGGVGLAALEFSEALLEIVEQAGGIRADRPRYPRCGGCGGGAGEPAPEKKRAAARQ